MASGHEYRANRPNTWLLRPMLQSEDSSCQPGAVHTWPKADLPFGCTNVRSWKQPTLTAMSAAAALSRAARESIG